MMLKTRIFKSLWVVIAIFGLGFVAQAQTGNIGINTDEPKATLDVKASTEMAGIIAPYVTGADLANNSYTASQNGAIAYITDATGASATGQSEFVKEVGYYYFQWGTPTDTEGRWVRLVQGNPIKENKVNWFYMPSIEVPTTETDPTVTVTVDLFDEYSKQFTTPKASSVATAMPKFTSATDFDYYVTDYDEDVLSEVAVSTDGKLTYKVIGKATPCSFINIVFVIR